MIRSLRELGISVRDETVADDKPHGDCRPILKLLRSEWVKSHCMSTGHAKLIPSETESDNADCNYLEVVRWRGRSCACNPCAPGPTNPNAIVERPNMPSAGSQLIVELMESGGGI